MITTSAPEIDAYLEAIKTAPGFADLFDVDVTWLDELEMEPAAWATANRADTQIIDGLWLRASNKSDQMLLANVCRLRALAWDAAVEPYRDEFPESIAPPTARFEAKGLPCVVIDRDGNGGDFVYADPGVVVFSRCAHIPHDLLYRYDPPAVPEEWLGIPAGSSNDSSKADQWVPSRAGTNRGLVPENGCGE